MILSATPVLLNYGYDDNISIKGGVVYTFDDVNYTDSSLLASAVDITLNNEQLLVLTQQLKLSNGLTNEITAPLPESYVYSTLIRDYAGNYLYATDPLNTEGSTISLTVNPASATVFNFYFTPTPRTIQIFYSIPYQTSTQNIYLVCNSNINTISGSPVNTLIDPSSYTYYYMLSEGALSLVSQALGIQTEWLVSNGNSVYFNGISGTSYNNLVLPMSSVFYATRLNDSNTHNSLQALGQSDLVKYRNTNDSLIVDNSSGNVPFNYLISSAFKNLTAGNAVIDANINPLKNYYSPMHGQTAVLSASLRNYTKIYTGLNEDDGFDKIYIGYNADTSRLTFTKDNDTYFHYPYSKPTTSPLLSSNTYIIPLSSTTLIDYGARADVSPFRADKIFKKTAGYRNYSSWGQTSNNPQNGVYFCSWLSAAVIGTDNVTRPVWVDRYYNPAAVNLTTIEGSLILGNKNLLIASLNNYPNLVWDVPSTLTFEQGALYYYHRVGEQDNQTIVDSITGLAYHIENWDTNLINSVDGLTAGSIVGFQPSNQVTDSTLKVPYYDVGNTYGYINTANSDFTNSAGTSLSFYAYQPDWTKIQGDQIVGNYFNGGVGLFNNNKILTPYFTVAARMDSSTGVVSSTIQTYNTDFVLLNSEPYNFTNYIYTPLFGGSVASTLSAAWTTPSFIVKNTYDTSYYIADNYAYKNYLATLDPSDLITNRVPLSTNLPFGTIITDTYIVPGSGGNVNIVTKNHPSTSTVSYRRYNTNGVLLASGTNTNSSATTAYNNFTLDLSGNVIWYSTNIPTTSSASISGYEMWYGTNATVDSRSNVFTLSGNGIDGVSATSWVLNKNGIAVLGINAPEYLNCDQADSLWVTYNNSYVAKIDYNGNVIWTKQININNPIVAPTSIRVVNFIAEYTSSGVVYYGLILDGKSQFVYKLDMDGNIVNSMSIPGLIPGGDSTGFDYQRKYVAPYITVPGVRAKLVTGDSTVPNPTPNYITLNYGTSALEAGWHNFTITFDQTNTAKLYVDGKVATQQTIYTPTPTSSIPPPTVTLIINGIAVNNGDTINVASNATVNGTVFGQSYGQFLNAVSADISYDGGATWIVGNAPVTGWLYSYFGPPSGAYVTGGGANSNYPLTATGPSSVKIRALAADDSVPAQTSGYKTITVNWSAPGASVPPNIINPPVTTTLPSILYTVYNYKNNPQIAIGTSNFKTGTLNSWIKIPDTYIFDGSIADLRVYDLALTPSDVKAITKNYLLNQFSDLTWNIPTNTRGYIEEIERFFLHRLPGSKSQYYNIRVKNSGIKDPAVQAIVESNLRAAAASTAPAHTQLRSIIWE